MSSDSERVSTAQLFELAKPVHVDTLTHWEADPYAGDVGQRALQSETFGQLSVVLTYGTEVLYGADLVEAQRHQPDDDGMIPALDLAGVGWPRLKAEAVADALWSNHRNSTVDYPLLAELRAQIIQEDEAVALAVGFDGDDLDALIEQIEADEHNVGVAEIEDPDHVPEPPTTEPVTKPGDVWLLGPHRVMCGDCTDPGTVDTVMDGHTTEMVHADPPYGMGKEKEGIANDNLYGPKLDAFQMQWWKTCRPHVQENGSAYIWGNPEDLWRLWYVGGLKDSERLSIRSQVIWDKPPSASSYGSPIGSGEMRSYPHGYETCLFFMFGQQVESTSHNNSDEYWEGWEPLRSYLAGEYERLGWGKADIAAATGTTGDMAKQWFTKSQWLLPTEERYTQLQAHAGADGFKREYDEIKREYDEIKREYDEIHAVWLRDVHEPWLAARAPFDNTHDNMTDVWEFPRVTGEDRHGHATPKPVALVERAVRSSSTEGGRVLVPFAGTLPEMIACEQAGRVCHAIELSPAYCDVICERWERATGVTPIRESDGAAVSFLDGD